MLALVGAEARLAASVSLLTSRRSKTRTSRRRTVRGDLAVRASHARWTLDGTDCPRAESGEILDESKLHHQCPLRPIDITDYCEVRAGEPLGRGKADDVTFFADFSLPRFSPAFSSARTGKHARIRDRRV